MSIPMSYERRSGHLPLLFRELILRLLSPQPIGTKQLKSANAGLLR